MGHSVMVRVDRWVPLGPIYEIFVRADQLTDADYRVRVEVGADEPVELRCLAPLPAGFWLRPARAGPLWVPPGDRYSTEEFRFDTEEPY